MKYSLFLLACATSNEKMSAHNNTPDVSIVSHTCGSEFYERCTDIFQETISDDHHHLWTYGK